LVLVIPPPELLERDEAYVLGESTNPETCLDNFNCAN
jgi:hypothetical protein